jgi:hypothetical protein
VASKISVTYFLSLFLLRFWSSRDLVLALSDSELELEDSVTLSAVRRASFEDWDCRVPVRTSKLGLENAGCFRSWAERSG